MCKEDLGALIFFVDPLSAHPHQADIDSLLRLANCGNVIICSNPTSAMSMMHTLRCALEKGSRGMIPSFFRTLESPAVAEYKAQQELALMAAVSGRGPAAAHGAAVPAAQDPPKENHISWERANRLESLHELSEGEHGSEDEEDGGEEEEKLHHRPRRGSTLVMPQKKKMTGILKILGKSMHKLHHHAPLSQ